MATALVLTLAGCAGEVDLSKSVTPRTTVKASGSFNDEALRMVEPCGLFTDDLINSIGKKATGGTNRDGYSECGLNITDAATGKQSIRMTVKVGVDVLAAPKQTAKSIRGLGVFETRGPSSCSQSAISGRGPDHGIVALVFWEGGDMCAAATKILESAIKQMAENPPLYQDTPGSLVKLEPCAAIDDTTATAVFGGAAQKIPYGIRSCIYKGKAPTVVVDYTIDGEPMTANSSQKPVRVDVTDKITGAAQYRSAIAPNKCVVEWVHRALSGNRSENVRVSFERIPNDPQEDPCAKVLEAARAVAGKLRQG